MTSVLAGFIVAFAFFIQHAYSPWKSDGKTRSICSVDRRALSSILYRHSSVIVDK